MLGYEVKYKLQKHFFTKRIDSDFEAEVGEILFMDKL